MLSAALSVRPQWIGAQFGLMVSQLTGFSLPSKILTSLRLIPLNAD
jgi:hypothetical protein